MTDEKIVKTGKSKYGHYLFTEDERFIGCTEQVVNFVKDKLPATVTITSAEGEGRNRKVNKVYVKEQHEKPKPQPKQKDNEMNMKMSVLKNKIMAKTSALDNATKLLEDEKLEGVEARQKAVMKVATDLYKFITEGCEKELGDTPVEGENPSN